MNNGTVIQVNNSHFNIRIGNIANKFPKYCDICGKELERRVEIVDRTIKFYRYTGMKNQLLRL